MNYLNKYSKDGVPKQKRIGTCGFWKWDKL